MKKLVLTFAIVFAGIMSVNAQLWGGGGIGAKVEKNHMNFRIAPEIGYALNDQWQLALGVDYAFSQVKTPDILDPNKMLVTNTNVLALEPYVRYVGGTIGKRFALFVDLTGDFNLLDSKGYAVLLRPGISWYPFTTDYKKFVAAFRFGYIGYDHGFLDSSIYQNHSGNGFVMGCEMAAPEIRFYYNF